MPALPLDEAGKYVAAAYLVFFLLLLVYLAIMAAKLRRVERELVELNELADEREGARPPTPAAGRPQERPGAVAGAGVAREEEA